MSEGTVAEALERLIDRLWATPPSAGELAAARLRMFDAAIAISLGAGLDQWRPVARLFRRLHGRLDAGTGTTAGVLAACCRLTEVDDIHLGSCTTPGSVVVPVTLALAATGIPAAELLTGAVAGYEAVVSAAELVGGAFALSAGVWPTRAVAPLAAAVTAARSIGLDRAAAGQAMALAASFDVAGRLPEPSRAASLGTAVSLGVFAALGAAEGLRADSRPLATWELGRDRSGGARQRPPARQSPAILATCVKPFCGARQALAAVSLVRRLVADGVVEPGEISQVWVGVPSQHVAMVSRDRLEHRLDTLASVRYLVSLALTDPAALDEVDHPAAAGEVMTRRMDSVRVEPAPELDAAFPARWGAAVRLTLPDRVECREASGVPGEEVLSWQSLDEKRTRLCRRATAAGETLDLVAGAVQQDEFAYAAALLAGALAKTAEEDA